MARMGMAPVFRATDGPDVKYVLQCVHVTSFQSRYVSSIIYANTHVYHVYAISAEQIYIHTACISITTVSYMYIMEYICTTEREEWFNGWHDHTVPWLSWFACHIHTTCMVGRINCVYYNV